MRPTRRRFLSWFLLATYAGIALLGEGLHSLILEGEQQHHHHGLYVVSHTCGDPYHHDDATNHDASTHASLTAADCDADSHVCEICAFLFQAISQPAEVAAPIEWEPFIAPAHAAPQPLYSLASLGPPAARGPPLFSA
jgi:hypothetical protein